MTRDFSLAPGLLRDANFEVVVSLGQRCEGSLECADYLDRIGMQQDAEAARMLRYRAAFLSDLAFKTAAEAPRVPA